jgi:hypothetical protein
VPQGSAFFLHPASPHAAPVQLDDQHRLHAQEIDDERPDSRLAPKFRVSQPPVANRKPEHLLDVSLVPPEVCGVGTDLAAHRKHRHR